MKKTKLKTILCYILALSILLCMAGCKKKPEPNNPSDQTGSKPATGESTTQNTQGTEPSQGGDPTTQTTPTTPTTPTTLPTEVTMPTEVEGDPNCIHTPSKWIVDVTSTCTKEGVRHKSCIKCDATLETEKIPMQDHVPGSWKVDKPADCKNEGRQHQECTQCQQTIITVTIAKADHNNTVIEAGRPATDTETGLTDYTICKTCDFVRNPYTIPIGTSDYGYRLNSDGVSCTVIPLKTEMYGAITVPETVSEYTVTAIGDRAFENIRTISSITLPASVTSIGEGAFAGCASLKSVVFQGTTDQWNAITKGANWDVETGDYTVRCNDTAAG